MKCVVNFSGGLCSFWAAHRVIEKFGRDEVTLLFADTLIESPDLYYFNEQAADILGVPVTRVSREMTPWELFRRKGMIGNARFPICSHKLKREVLDEWHRANCLELDTILYVGMDWTEGHRLAKMRAAKPTWRIEAPMMEAPYWDKCRMISEAKKLGLQISQAYELGFPHDNCGWRCVAAGISHWAHLLKVRPDLYLEWEAEEEMTIQILRAQGIEALTMLKDRRGGQSRPLTLRQLRFRIEAGEKVARDEWGGCGCGVQYDAMKEAA